MSRRILIVDDEQHHREIMQYSCRQEGFEPVAVESEYEALVQLMAEEPLAGVIVGDLRPRGLASLCLVHDIRESFSDRLPIIMVSVAATTAAVTAGRVVGADRYLTKPFSMRQLMAVLEELTAEPAA